MKNFRKTIIALATVAAMLVPSAAMAATLTTTVDKDITGDVYVGFYDGAILKDVVKTTVDDITVADATPAGTEETLPATVTIDNVEVGKVCVADPNAMVYKLVFTATAPQGINSFVTALSYDSTVVGLISAPVGDIPVGYDIPNDQIVTYYGSGITPFSLLQYEVPNVIPTLPATKKSFQAATPKVATLGDRVGVYISQLSGSNATADLSNGRVMMEFYYKVLEGKEVTADTFKIETEIGAGTMNALINSAGAENGIKLANPSGGYTYGAWSNGTAVADTIKLVTPWDVQEPTTKDLEVTVPTGAEGYKATMFIWDADQIAQCDPIALN